MESKFFFPIIIAALIVCTYAVPASAALLEVTLEGTVSALDVEKNTITIENPARYGCNFPADGAPDCTFTPIDSVPVTGTVPNSAVFSVFKTGDTAVATSLGGTGGTWITLAKLYGSGQDEQYVTDIVGNDPGAVPFPLVGDYALDITTIPDCTTCYGTTCTATSANVKVKSSGTVVFAKVLEPRQMLEYNGRNDGSSIAVTFVKGEASSRECPAGAAGMAGPQPISVFVVNVVPPVGFAPQDAAATDAGAAQETVPVPTTKAGLLPTAAIGALGMVALVFALRRQ